MQRTPLLALLALSLLLTPVAQAGEVQVDIDIHGNRVIVVDPDAPRPRAVTRRVVVVDTDRCWFRTGTIRVGDDYVRRRVWSCA